MATSESADENSLVFIIKNNFFFSSIKKKTFHQLLGPM